MSSIELKQVIKRYGAVEVVHGIDLAIQDGEFVVLLGPSGCGKSTTLRMIAGLEDISDGELIIGGKPMNDRPPKERGVAMVFQNYALYPHMTVRQNMEFALRPMKLESQEVDKRISDAAEILGLSELLARKPSQLSGGQRQRVAMARAMVRTPKVFLFDEPLSNLDAKLRTQVRWEIGKLHKRLGTTVVYVTHDQVEAMTLADRIVIMRDGRIEQVGTPEEVFEKPRNSFVATFIGSPAMNMIPATVRGGHLVGDGLSVPLPQRYSGKVSEDQAVMIGIRPADIEIVDADHSGACPAKVGVTEYLGKELLLDVYAGSHELICEVSASKRIASDSTISIRVRPDALHLFNAHSGNVIE